MKRRRDLEQTPFSRLSCRRNSLCGRDGLSGCPQAGFLGHMGPESRKEQAADPRKARPGELHHRSQRARLPFQPGLRRRRPRRRPVLRPDHGRPGEGRDRARTGRPPAVSTGTATSSSSTSGSSSRTAARRPTSSGIRCRTGAGRSSPKRSSAARSTSMTTSGSPTARPKAAAVPFDLPATRDVGATLGLVPEYLLT